MSSVPHDVHRETVITRLAKLQTFVTSTLIILVILTVITEQQIQEFEREVAVLARQRREAATRLPAGLQTLVAISNEFEPAVFTPIVERMAPVEAAAKAERENENKRLTRPAEPIVEVNYEELARRFGLPPDDAAILRGSAMYLQMNGSWNREGRSREWIVGRMTGERYHISAGYYERDHERALSKISGLETDDRAAVEQMLTLPPPRNSAIRRAEIERVRAKLEAASAVRNNMYAPALTKLAALSEAFETYARNRDALQNIAREVETVRTRKQSLPSPFGQFDLHPKLALVFLAFAAAGSYFVFFYSERRTLRIAGQIVPGSAPLAAPPWVFTRDEALQHTLGLKGDGFHRIAPPALHLFWLGLSFFLTAEILRYRAGGLLRVLPETLTVTSLVLANGAAAAIAFSLFQPAGLRSRLRRNVRGRWPSMTRRTAFRLSAAGVIGFLFAGIHRRALDSVWPARFHPPLRLPVRLVRNRKTQVAHSERYCQDHLPKRRDFLDPGLTTLSIDNPALHRQHEVAVLFDAVKFKRERLIIVYDRMTENYDDFDHYPKEEKRIKRDVPDLLYRAIELQPWSFHLHDQLIGWLGHQQRYDEIRQFLDHMMDRAWDGLREDAESRVARTRVQWVAARIRGFENRARRAEKRAAAARDAQKKESVGAVLPPGAAPS